MKERPILFSAPMVRAILEGRKTQTRRIIKPTLSGIPSGGYGIGDALMPANGSKPIYPRYGHPGELLWVRETWQGPLIDEELDDEFRQSPDYFKKPAFCAYRATDTLDAINADGEELGWRPSIHMPRWASRIQLEVTGVRVERLQEISEADALAEGIEPIPYTGENGGPNRFSINMGGYWLNSPTAAGAYRMLWETINGDGSRAANPWVWVVEFKRVTA